MLRHGLALVPLVLWLPARPALADPIRLGDINRDGAVNVTDLTHLFRWLSGAGVDACKNAGDLNADGALDYSDLALLSHLLFGESGGPYREVTVPLCEPGDLQIAEEEAVVLAPDSALVTWRTAVPSGTRVRFGTNAALGGRQVEVDEDALFHQAYLKGLRPGTTYYYRVESEAGDGSRSSSATRSFRTLSDEPYSVRAGHPRLFLTSADLPEIRSRIAPGGTHEEFWRKLSGWCASQLGTPVHELAQSDLLVDSARAFAFAGLVSSDEACRQKAIDLALHVAKGGSQGEARDDTEAMAYVYDWAYGNLSEPERALLARKILSGCLALEGASDDDEFVTGMSHGNNKSMMLGALAIYEADDRVPDLVDRVFDNYRYGFLATWRRFAGADGGSSKGWWYTTYVLPFEFEVFAAWKSATGANLFQTERIWFEGGLDWFLYGLRGDGTFIREGDALVFNGVNYENRYHALLAAKELGSSRAQWFADLAGELSRPWGPKAVLDILWWDPEVEPEPPSGPTSKLFKNVGLAVMRDSWERDAAIATFRSAEVYTLGHTHRDNCSFTLYYKGDLAIDSGIYDDFKSKHRDNYYCRTIAHNGITVFDPDEVFVKFGTLFENDGGQRWLVPGTDVPHAWPTSIEQTVDRSSGYRLGGILRYEDASDYTYVLGDGGPSYSPAKLKRLHRHFLWLKNVDGWGHPVAVVLDDVVSTQPSFRKTYLLHLQEKPRLEGRTLTARHRHGALHHVTLEPEAAKLTLVGGPGREFLVNGSNYEPVRPPRDNESAGSWRLEVTPQDSGLSHRFLHAIYVGDADAAPPESPSRISASGFTGAQVENWAVLFKLDPSSRQLIYRADRPRTSHFLAGTRPSAPHDIYLDDRLVESVSSSDSGILVFHLRHAGQVKIVQR